MLRGRLTGAVWKAQTCKALQRFTETHSVSAYLFVQPVWVLDSGHRVGNPLHGSWNGDDLLNSAAQPLLVVGPVHNAPHIRSIIRAVPCNQQLGFSKKQSRQQCPVTAVQ